MAGRTPEEFVQILAQRGVRIELEADGPEPRFRLTGPKEQITERIREYIRCHRDELIVVLASTHDQAEDTTEAQAEETIIDESPIAIGDTASALTYVPCHLAQYGLCSNQVIEQDESTWRMSSPDGLVFCVACWQSRNIEQAERAHSCLADHKQPTDLETRIERIMAGPGYGCCGGHDWRVDFTGILVCRQDHTIEAGEQPEPQLRADPGAQPWQPTAQEKRCSVCNWRAACTWVTDAADGIQHAYCVECYEKKDQAQSSAA